MPSQAITTTHQYNNTELCSNIYSVTTLALKILLKILFETSYELEASSTSNPQEQSEVSLGGSYERKGARRIKSLCNLPLLEHISIKTNIFQTYGVVEISNFLKSSTLNMHRVFFRYSLWEIPPRNFLERISEGLSMKKVLRRAWKPLQVFTKWCISNQSYADIKLLNLDFAWCFGWNVRKVGHTLHS